MLAPVHHGRTTDSDAGRVILLRRLRQPVTKLQQSGRRNPAAGADAHRRQLPDAEQLVDLRPADAQHAAPLDRRVQQLFHDVLLDSRRVPTRRRPWQAAR